MLIFDLTIDLFANHISIDNNIEMANAIYYIDICFFKYILFIAL